MSFHRSQIANEQPFACEPDLARAAKPGQGTCDAHPVCAYEESDLFMGEGEGNGPSTRRARTDLPSDIDQNLIKPIFEVGL